MLAVEVVGWIATLAALGWTLGSGAASQRESFAFLAGTGTAGCFWLGVVLAQKYRRERREALTLQALNSHYSEEHTTLLDAKRWLLQRWLKQPPWNFLDIAESIETHADLSQRFRLRPRPGHRLWWRRIYDPDSKARLAAITIAPSLAIVLTLSAARGLELGELLVTVFSFQFFSLWLLLLIFVGLTLGMAAGLWDLLTDFMEARDTSHPASVRLLMRDLLEAYELPVHSEGLECEPSALVLRRAELPQTPEPMPAASSPDGEAPPAKSESIETG
jgi:hypothetical protein